MNRKKCRIILIMVVLFAFSGTIAYCVTGSGGDGFLSGMLGEPKQPFRELMEQRRTRVGLRLDEKKSELSVMVCGPELDGKEFTVACGDDIKAYPAEKMGPEAAVLKIPMADFGYKTGTYTVSWKAADAEASIDYALFGGVKSDPGKMEIFLTGIGEEPLVEAVDYEIRYAEDESDVRVLKGQDSTDGFRAKMDIADHNYHVGTYQVRTKVTIGEEQYDFGVQDVEINPENYILTRPDNDNHTRQKITILNPKAEGKTPDSVVFASWSDTDGQDDLVSHDGVKAEDGSWSATVSVRDHTGADDYTTEVLLNGAESAGEVHYDLERTKKIALTFDDGPSSHTPALLDALEDHGAHATFFVVGSCAKDRSDTIKRELNAGCEVGTHTTDHTYLNRLDEEDDKTPDIIEEKVWGANEIVCDITGNMPEIMRPPGGGVNGTVREYVRMPMILWSIDTRDWETRDTQSTIDCVLENISEGDIVLMHDLYGESVDAAVALIPKLIDMGYDLLTVSELANWAGCSLENGKTYSSFR